MALPTFGLREEITGPRPLPPFWAEVQLHQGSRFYVRSDDRAFDTCWKRKSV